MINSYIIIKNFVSLINAFMLVYFFYKTMPSKENKNNKLYSIIMIIFYTLISSNVINNNMVYNFKENKMFSFICTYYILVLIYPLFFRKGRMSEKLFLSSFYITMMIVSSFIVYITFSEIWHVKLFDIFFYKNYKGCIVMLLDRVVQFIFIYI